MKGIRLWVCFAFCGLFSARAAGEVSMSDIWRWGLLRKTDVLPVNSSMTYLTGGVLRVVETWRTVDTNRFTLTVTSNLVAGGAGAVLSNGVYLSTSASVSTDSVGIAWSGYWGYVAAPAPVPAYAWWVEIPVALTNEGTQQYAATSYWADAGFISPTNQGVFGELEVLTRVVPGQPTRPVVAMGDWKREWTNAPAAGSATNFTLRLDPYADNADGVFLTRFQTNAVAWPIVFSNAVDTATLWTGTNAWNGFPVTLYGVEPSTNPPSGVAVIDFYGYTYTVTNDFVSSTLLQDTIDDLRQEISEAIEGHVELLHP